MSDAKESNKQAKIVSPPVTKQDEEEFASPNEANVAENKNTPKRTPNKRRSFIERAQRESEELVRTMGGTLELEGGRRTRSSTRGTPIRVASPPPTKKAKTSQSTTPLTTPTKARGRVRKTLEVDTEETSVSDEVVDKVKEKLELNEPTNQNESVKEKEETEVKKSTEAKEVVKLHKLENSNEIAVDSEDKTDTVAISKSIPEEEQNNVEHVKSIESQPGVAQEAEIVKPANANDDVKENAEAAANEKEIKSDEEAMDTDVPAESSSSVTKNDSKSSAQGDEAPEINSIASNAKANAKEPTPEPMEVDSSSKSNSSEEAADSGNQTPESSKPTVEVPIKPTVGTVEVSGNSAEVHNTEKSNCNTTAPQPNETNSENAVVQPVELTSNNVEHDTTKTSQAEDTVNTVVEPVASKTLNASSENCKSAPTDNGESKIANNTAAVPASEKTP